MMYRVLASFAVVICSWYLMMAFHEVGHVLHAWASGGEVSQLSFPVWGFSATALSTNPHPLFVAWGGPAWGCLLPAGLLVTAHLLKTKYVKLIQYLAGFCFIANGAYLGVGSFWDAGDAGDLLRHGAHQAWLIGFGVLTIVLGLLVWHKLGPRFGLRDKS